MAAVAPTAPPPERVYSPESVADLLHRLDDLPADRVRADPPATTFVLGLESSPMRAERELYALGRWCREHPALLKAIDDRPSDQPAIELVRGAAPDDVDHDVWQQWRQRIGSYLDTFGHTITDLDFSNPVAADDPAAVLETIKFYATDDRPQAESDPGARQHRLATEREQATQALLGRIGPARRAIGPVLAKAQHFGGLREDALADVGLAWPLIRQLLTELGSRLTAAGALADPQDVYWLQAAEIEDAAATLDRGRQV